MGDGRTRAMAQHGLVFERQQEGDRFTLGVTGEADVDTAPALRGALLELIDDGARHIAIDLGGTEFLDSTALGVLVGAMKRLKAIGGSLTVRSPSPRVRQIIDLTGLAGTFG